MTQFNHVISDRPPSIEPVWMVDINKIHTMPPEAIAAIVHCMNLPKMKPEAFKAIVAIG